jgi:hypothetical protein
MHRESIPALRASLRWLMLVLAVAACSSNNEDDLSAPVAGRDGTGVAGQGGAGAGGAGGGQAGTTSTVCVPGATQVCLGPGACQGAQTCRDDGSGYEPCNCGSAGIGGFAGDGGTSGAGGDAGSGGNDTAGSGGSEAGGAGTAGGGGDSGAGGDGSAGQSGGGGTAAGCSPALCGKNKLPSGEIVDCGTCPGANICVPAPGDPENYNVCCLPTDQCQTGQLCGSLKDLCGISYECACSDPSKVCKNKICVDP